MRKPEDDLAIRCRAGDMEAFSLLYARYEQQVFRYAYHLLGNREDADDIKQETFLRAYKAVSKFRGDASLQTWLLKICGNLCRDRLKSWEWQKVTYSTVSDDHWGGDGGTADPLRILERSQTTDVILKALYGMPPPQREVIILHEIEDMGYEEIAVILGCSKASVKLRLFRARRCLKDRVTGLLSIRE